MNFQTFFRTQTIAFAAFVSVATLAFAGCGGGGGSTSGGTLAGCLGYGGGGGGGGGGTGAGCNPSPTPSVDPSAQPVAILLTGENPVSVPTYGDVLGFTDGMTMSAPSGSGIVHLTAGESVQFGNIENTGGLPHTASSLGPWSGSFPTNGPTAAQENPSATGSSIGAAGFSTGVLNPGLVSKVYTTGGSGQVIVFGCFFHYVSNNMRTVVIVM